MHVLHRTKFCRCQSSRPAKILSTLHAQNVHWLPRAGDGSENSFAPGRILSRACPSGHSPRTTLSQTFVANFVEMAGIPIKFATKFRTKARKPALGTSSIECRAF